MKSAMIIGWVIVAALSACWFADAKYLKALVKARENARDLWHNEAKRVREELGRYRGDLKDRDNAIAALRMEIDSLTPKRSKNGRFARKKK